LEQSQSSKHDKYQEEAEPSKSDDVVVSSMENGEFNDTEDCGIVRLPMEDGVNTSRTVPGVCTICLCAYEDGDQITWSTETLCQHAFHTECIVQWLAKKEEPRCPVCRQEFCPAADVSTVGEAFAVDMEREHSFLQSFSHALALSQLYRPFNSEPPPNNDPTRRASITIQLASLAVENQTQSTNGPERTEGVPETSTPTTSTESDVSATANTEPIVESEDTPLQRV
jgi:Ring finger domain